jgi:hypothetical protein
MFSRVLCLVGCLNSPFCNLAAAIVEIAAAIVENATFQHPQSRATTASPLRQL